MANAEFQYMLRKLLRTGEVKTMTVMQAMEQVQAAAKKFAPLVPEVVQAVSGVAGDLTAHKSAMTDLMDAVMLAEQVIAAATGL